MTEPDDRDIDLPLDPAPVPTMRPTPGVLIVSSMLAGMLAVIAADLGGACFFFFVVTSFAVLLHLWAEAR